MSFISYAQNCEDVILYRALREVKNGFYIDVGAQDPVIDSVTKAFYDRGWRGVNIEPIEEYFRKLQSARPHDINLRAAVGREPGVISFHEVAHTGLSTANAEYARRHAEAGYEVRFIDAPCTTLDRICADCDVKTVNFLKIDVEGSERAVLEGFSFEAVRPWILVIEATEPNSDRQVFTEWENLLVEHRYRFVYFDGLNRFYIAEEHSDLEKYFSSPPNPFDQYVGYRLWQTHAELEQMRTAEHSALVNSLNHLLTEVQSRADEAQSLRKQLDDQVKQLDDQVQSLRKQLDHARGSSAASEQRLRSIRSSLSWRLTKPVREIRRAAVRIGRWVRRVSGKEDSAKAARGQSDQVAAGLTEPARVVYRTLRDTMARRR
jgi:FkbM family methyltransferase